jgi:hypothetical protein
MNKKSIQLLTTLAAGLCFAASAAQGVILVTFSFDNPDDNSNEVSSSGFIDNDLDGALSNAIADRGAGLTAVPWSSALISSGWDTLGSDDYVSLRFAVEPGFSAFVSSLRLETVSGDRGPRDLAIRSSADGFTSDIATFIHDGGFSSVIETYVFSEPLSFEDVVEFRIFSTSDTSANGQSVLPAGIFRIDYAQFEVSVIPEPSTYAAIVGALFLGLVIYRRRRG